MDSYQKYVESYSDHCYGLVANVFDKVKAIDLDEVKAHFIVNVSKLEFADNFRVYPLSQEKEYTEQQNKGCCGFWDVQFKCKSGNIYLLGCNYGH